MSKWSKVWKSIPLPLEVYPLLIPVFGTCGLAVFMGWRHLRLNPSVWVVGSQDPQLKASTPKNFKLLYRDSTRYEESMGGKRG
jgi:hypothetical protein